MCLYCIHLKSRLVRRCAEGVAVTEAGGAAVDDVDPTVDPTQGREHGRRPGVEDIYLRLRRQICLLQRPPGQRLREEPLAAEFGVSRTPVRQVLSRLQHERLVTHEPGLGAFVAIVDSKEIRDVWAVRLKLTELTTAFVNLPAPEPVLAELRHVEHAIDDIRTARDRTGLAALYHRYFAIVLQVCTSTTLRRISDELFHLTTREWLQFLPELDFDDEVDVMAVEVADTIKVMQDSDPAVLTQLRLDHMNQLLRRFNDHLSRPLG